ncbi:MAG: acetyl xylan esterase [Methylococcaceae bacterium]|jgi:hypothetical protein|nr:MAG: acetyl xylan esterase [Methylococcaceae bacterium]
MNLHFFLLLILFFCNQYVLAEQMPPRQATHLFILAGQSNMARLNPELSFVPTLKNALPNDQLLFIKDAKGGQAIRQWRKDTAPQKGNASAENNGKLYQKLVHKIMRQLHSSPIDTITFIWMQGERDAQERLSAQYGYELSEMINQLKHDTGRNDLNVVLGRLTDFGLKRRKVNYDWEQIRHLQVDYAEHTPHTTWVDTDDLNGANDDLHLTPDGYYLLGERFAHAALKLIAQP